MNEKYFSGRWLSEVDFANVEKVLMCNEACKNPTPSIHSMPWKSAPGISATINDFFGNTATPTCVSKKCAPEVKKEEGNNPMRYDSVTVAPSISIEAGATEAATQREYLLKRLDKIERSFQYGDKYYEIRKVFDIDARQGPKNYKELIEAIKGGKYTIDPKVEKRLARIEEDMAAAGDDVDDRDYDYDYLGMSEGIIWTDFPKADYKAFNAALETAKKKSQDVKDAIAIMDPKDALEALKAFEAWMPTKATDTAQ